MAQTAAFSPAPESPAPRPAQTAFAGIELLRFLSALSILCWHYQDFFWGYRFEPAQQPFHALLRLFFERDSGEFAVKVFWAISGFIFFWKYADPIHLRQVSGWVFFVRRFSRLYPLHVVTLVAVAVLQAIYTPRHEGYPFVYAGNNAEQFVFQLLFASYWVLHETASFNGPVWSVMVELLAYALFFFISSGTRLRGMRSSMMTLAIFALVWYQGAIIGNVYAVCFLLFFVGGATYNLVCLMTGERRSPRLRGAWNAFRLAGLLLVVATISDTYLNHFLADTLLGASRQAALLYLYFVFIPALLVVFASLSVPAPRLQAATSSLGNLTYASYMIHVPLQLLVITCFDVIGMPRGFFMRPVTFLAYIGLVFLLSYLVHSRFERPMQELLRKKLGG